MNANLAIVLVLMFVVSFLYNRLVEYTERQLPKQHGLTSIMVVGGCCLYLFGQFLITNVETTIVSLLLFIALGSFLIIGSISRFLNK